MRNWVKTLLFISAFSPVLLTLAWVKSESEGLSLSVLGLIVLGMVGIGVTVLIVHFITNLGESLAFRAKKIESSDWMLFVFIASYFSPFLASATSFDATQAVIIALGLLIIFWMISSIPSHPTLRLLRFRFYKVELETGMIYTLIARRELGDPRDIRFVKKISSSMLLEDPPCR